jgi:hypothetical protein
VQDISDHLRSEQADAGEFREPLDRIRRTSPEWGKFAGVRVFEEEESRGLELMNALTVDQQRRAIIGKKASGRRFCGRPGR